MEIPRFLASGVGGERLNEEVGKVLHALVEKIESPEERKILANIAQGKRPLSDLTKCEEFGRLAQSGLEDFRSRRRRSTPEAQAEAMAGDVEFARSNGLIGEHDVPPDVLWSSEV